METLLYYLRLEIGWPPRFWPTLWWGVYVGLWLAFVALTMLGVRWWLWGKCKNERGMEKKRSSEMNRQGFTLIELLTVIAIIALLVGIMVPVLGSARDSARALLCATNLRSLQTGMSQFTADNSNRYGGGLAKEWVTDTYWGVWWGQSGQVNIAGRGNVGDADYVPSGDIWSYVREPNVYLCPIFDRVCGRPSTTDVWAPGKTYGEDYSRSFEVQGITATFTMPESFNAVSGKPVRSYAMNELLAPYSRDAAGEVCRKTDHTVLIDPKAIWLTEVHPCARRGSTLRRTNSSECPMASRGHILARLNRLANSITVRRIARLGMAMSSVWARQKSTQT